MSTRGSQGAQRLERPEVWGGIALAVVAVVAWVCARDLPVGALRQPGPGLFPKGLAVILGLLALGILGRGLAGPADSVRALWPERSSRRRVGAMLAALAGYVLVVEWVGFLIATAALFVVMLRGVGRRSWVETLATAVLASGGSYLLFARWLMVSLPGGAWLP